jgi:secreted PhoX family phosphatase
LSDGKLVSLVAAFIILALVVHASRVDALSSSQTPVIRIGEWKSPSYGVLTPWGGLAFDPAGNLWVADSANNRVLGFMPPFSNNMSASYVMGQPDFVGNGSGIGADRLNYPIGVAFDRDGNLWVSDTRNNRLLEFDSPFHNGMNASVVIGQSNFWSNSSSLSRNALSGPWGITFDASGDLWVADVGNSRVLEFQPPFTSNMNASLVVGELDFTRDDCNPLTLPLSSNGKCGTRTILNVPWQVAFDPSGDLWVAEGWNSGRLLEFKPPFNNGMQTSVVMQPVYASAVTFDSAGNIWLGCWDCGLALEYRPPFSENSIVWENGVAVNATVSLGGYPASGNYSFYDANTIPNVMTPVGLTFDSAGNLWVADSRSSWLMANLIGRVVAYDAQVHPLDTQEGRVYFENQGGLLAPLSAIPVTQMDSIQFPEGLFNFTIQGLPAGGSVMVTVSFSHSLSSGIEWWSRRGDQWKRLPATQVQVEANNMTLTLTNASRDGVISEFGGPILGPTNATTSAAITTTATTRTTTASIASQPQNPSQLTVILGVTATIVIALTTVALYRKHARMSNRNQNA